MIRCSKCREVKPSSEFHRNKRHATGYANVCKVCTVPIAAASRKKHYETHPGYYRARAKLRWLTDREVFERPRLRRLYGITIEQRAAMLVEQRNRCAICDTVFVGAPHIDHDHATKTVRGLLCGNCNRMLGSARDNVDTLRAAVAYLGRARLKVVV